MKTLDGIHISVLRQWIVDATWPSLLLERLQYRNLVEGRNFESLYDEFAETKFPGLPDPHRAAPTSGHFRWCAPR
jgi:hypothetical protein